MIVESMKLKVQLVARVEGTWFVVLARVPRRPMCTLGAGM